MHSLFYNNCMLLLIMLTYTIHNVKGELPKDCSHLDFSDRILLNSLSHDIVPDFNNWKRKGQAGRILVIGGSVEYTGAPYFAAISALKVGADLVHVVTTEGAAPVIKSYSPDLIVHPIRNIHSLSKISALLPKMHVIVIGPGLGRESEDIQLVWEVIETCKMLMKPLIIDADGLYAISKNISILKDYPSPGAILTPNNAEAKRLKEAMPTTNLNKNWTDYWGKYVSVLEKGEEDRYHSSLNKFGWSFSGIGSTRRAGGQGDILAGSLATLYHWAKEANLCENEISINLGQSVAAYAAAKLTRTCNSNAFAKSGRSMIASDMIDEIHTSFEQLFEKL